MKSKEEQKNYTPLGVGAVGGGGLLVKKQFTGGNLTGRETAYHYTENKNVPSILAEGLKGSKTNQKGTVVNEVLGKHISNSDLANKTYVAKKKAVAKSVETGKRLRNLYMGGPMAEPGTILKLNVPLWKHKQVENPELMGAKNKSEFVDKITKAKPQANTPIGKALAGMSYKGLSKETATVEGDISNKFIKNSPEYAKNSINEIKSFIKANPKRFAKGTTLAAAGTAIAAMGGKLIFGKTDKKLNKEAQMTKAQHTFNELIKSAEMSTTEKVIVGTGTLAAAGGAAYLGRKGIAKGIAKVKEGVEAAKSAKGPKGFHSKATSVADDLASHKVPDFEA